MVDSKRFVHEYLNSNWPINPMDTSNLFESQKEIGKWINSIPEHLHSRFNYDSEFHPLKLLMLLDQKAFWTKKKQASQNWESGIGFRTGLTLMPSPIPGKVILPFVIDADDPKTVEVLNRIIAKYNLTETTSIQNTPHGGIHLIGGAYVDPNNLEEIGLWEEKKSLIEKAGCWLNDAKCSIKINCQQITLFPSKHRKDGSNYKLNKVTKLVNNAWILDEIVKAFVEGGLLECTPEQYHERMKSKKCEDSSQVFDTSDWFELTDEEIKRSVPKLLGDELFKPIYYEGVRHDNTRCIAGSMAWSHISQNSTERFYDHLMEITGDDEHEDRYHVIRETYQRIVTPNQNVEGRYVMTELFRAAHKDRDANAAADRFEEFRKELGLGHKKIRRNVTVTECLKLDEGEQVRVHDCMISGAQIPEKMITGIESKCLNCNNINKFPTYSKRPRFAYELEGLKRRPLKCVNCSEPEFELQYKKVNARQIEVQALGAVDELQFLNVVLVNDSADKIQISEDAILTGSTETLIIKGKMIMFLFVGYEEGSTIEYLKVRDDSNLLTEEDETEIGQFIEDNREDMWQKVREKFAISVIGLDYEKSGTILSMNNAAKDAVEKKTRLNAIYAGDPGLAKSHLIRCAVTCVPHSKFVSGINSTVKSDIAIIDKDNTNMTFRPGPILKASGALCGMDEIGRMSFTDQPFLQSAVNEGIVHFGSYGFHFELEASATFLMSANPIGSSGRWSDGNLDIGAIPVIGTLLDRIDLVYLMETNRDPEYLKNYAGRKIDMLDDPSIYEEEANNHKWISKVLLYCKRFNPKISNAVKSMLISFYVSIASDANSKASPRLLGTLYNLCISLAKLKGKNEVDVNDATEVMTFFKKQYECRVKIELEIPKEPFEVTKNLIISAIKDKDCWYIFNELLTNLYNENESVKDYFDNKLILSSKKSRKYRNLTEWVEGDNRIKLLSKTPLKIAWVDSYKDNRGGKQDNVGGRPQKVWNNVLEDNQSRAQGDKVTAMTPLITTEKTILAAKCSETQSTLSPCHPVTFTMDFGYRIEDCSILPVPTQLTSKIPQLNKLFGIDFEWDADKNNEIYAYCATNSTGNTTRMFLDDEHTKEDRTKFINAILDSISPYDTIVAYGISLDTTKEWGRDTKDGDWKILEMNCRQVKLYPKFEKIHRKVKLLDTCRVYSNDAIEGMLGQTDITYRDRHLGTVAQSVLGIGKIEGVSGGNVRSKDHQVQLDYCLRDAQLAIMLLAKNDYEMLDILYNFSDYIKLDFYSTVNSTGPFMWWKHFIFTTLKCPPLPKDIKNWVEEHSYDTKGNRVGVDFTGAKVFEMKPGFYLNAYIFDVNSMYPSQIDFKNLGPDTIMCNCHKNDKSAEVSDNIMKMVNLQLKEPRPWHYWVCTRRSKLADVMKDLIEKKREYKRQKNKTMVAVNKLLMNSGYGVLKYIDVRLNDLITAFSRDTLLGLSNKIEALGGTVLLGDTDSVGFTIPPEVKNIDSIITPYAKEQYGVTFTCDKTYQILFVTNLKKQYFGILLDGSLSTKTLTGMKDDKPAFFNDVLNNLITLDYLRPFIKTPIKAQNAVKKYVLKMYRKLEHGCKDLEFVNSKLAFSQVADKNLSEYTSNDWHRRAFNEMVNNCNGDEVFAQKKTQRGEPYKYYKTLVPSETKTKKGKLSNRKIESTTTYCIEKHYQNINVQKYKDELWVCLSPVLISMKFDIIPIANELGVKIKKEKKV